MNRRRIRDAIVGVVLGVVVWMFYTANAKDEKRRNRVDSVVYQISRPLERAFVAVFKSWMGVWKKYLYRVDLKKENERLEQENAALAANNHYLAAVAKRGRRLHRFRAYMEGLRRGDVTGQCGTAAHRHREVPCHRHRDQPQAHRRGLRRPGGDAPGGGGPRALLRAGRHGSDPLPRGHPAQEATLPPPLQAPGAQAPDRSGHGAAQRGRCQPHRRAGAAHGGPGDPAGAGLGQGLRGAHLPSGRQGQGGRRGSGGHLGGGTGGSRRGSPWGASSA